MIYFDNAATTFPKPASVIRAAAESMRRDGNPGRGAHRAAMSAAREVYRTRSAAAEMFGASAERVIFTLNTTHALNLAIKGAHRKFGGGILISDVEHNSVRRPAMALTSDVRVFDSAPELDGEARTAAILASAASLADSDTRILVCTAASNITGAAMPIRELGEFCRERGIFFIVDGAQGGGTLPLSVADDGIGALCLPGHKGLYGPMGVGMLILGGGVRLPTLIEGGSGVNSRESVMPDEPPESLEAGTLPVPAIAGLGRGIAFVRRQTPAAIFAHECRLAAMMRDGLMNLSGRRMKVYCPHLASGTVLFRMDGMPSEELAAHLSERGFAVRAGLHCAPMAHERLGIPDGAVRVSFGAFNHAAEVREFLHVMEAIK